MAVDSQAAIRMQQGDIVPGIRAAHIAVVIAGVCVGFVDQRAVRSGDHLHGAGIDLVPRKRRKGVIAAVMAFIGACPAVVVQQPAGGVVIRKGRYPEPGVLRQPRGQLQREYVCDGLPRVERGQTACFL